MARRVNISQLNNQMRQAQQRAQRQLKQQVDKANRQIKQEVDRVNRENKRAVDKVNRQLKQEHQQRQQKVRREVSTYNQKVATHNARVRSNRQRLANELRRLSSHQSTPALGQYKTSVDTVTQRYESMETQAEAGRLGEGYNEILDLSEREAANNAAVANALLDDEQDADSKLEVFPENPAVLDFLKTFSGDLVARWEGAIFALSAKNPDAARHFCTSSREIITQILEQRATDKTVIEERSECEMTQHNKPTRRAKIGFLLRKMGLWDGALEDFIEADMENIVELFTVFNKGTHGSAGKYSLSQLVEVRRRVEDGLEFLSKIAA